MSSVSSREVSLRPHDAALDGLRGLAILMVVGLHFNVLRGGFIGVDVFFVLSGFLITSILHREIARTGSVDFRLFWTKRVFRLVPALLLCASALALFDSDATLEPILAALSYTMNYAFAYGFVGENALSHSWSLAVEMQFYLLWPIILLLMTKYWSDSAIAVAIVALAFACAAWRAILSARYGAASIDFTYRVLEARADPLLLGAATAILIRCGWRFRSRAVFLLCCAVIAAVLWRIPPGKVAFHEVGFPIIGLATAYVVGFLVTAGDAPVRRVFEFQPLCYLGRISYGVYLYHFPILEAVKHSGIAHPILTTAASTLAAAALSFHLVERPLLGRIARPEPILAT